MQNKNYILQLFSCMFLMLLLVGFFQSWNLALSIFNLCIISAIMSLGINIQWGNAGIVNFGVMGFAALGGLANVIISMPPTHKAWEEGGILIFFGLLTRWAIIAQLPILIGAVIINFIGEMNTFNLFISSITFFGCVFFMLYGSGKHSADYYFKMQQ